MPNWCDCQLKVSGPRADVEKFKHAVACPDDCVVFRINNLFPTPDSLVEVSAGSDESSYVVLYGSDAEYDTFVKLYKIVAASRDDALAEYSKLCMRPVEELRSKADAYCRNVEEFGHRHWYSWRIANWGTKWDVTESSIVKSYDSDDDKVMVYRFNSAWSPPTPALSKISTMFPTLSFKLRYFEGGCGFKGIFMVRDGVVIKDMTSDYSGNRGG